MLSSSDGMLCCRGGNLGNGHGGCRYPCNYFGMQFSVRHMSSCLCGGAAGSDPVRWGHGRGCDEVGDRYQHPHLLFQASDVLRTR